MVADPPPFCHLRRAVFVPAEVRVAAPPNRQKVEPFGRREAEEQPMTAATWITMFTAMAFVWGGFSLVLLTAIRKESDKSGDA